MEMKYKEWILETIDSLRSRKARPDVERICRMIERRYGLSPADTEQQLNKLVRAELVVKVAYKGSNSYRNAAKWYKSKARKGPECGAEGGGGGGGSSPPPLEALPRSPEPGRRTLAARKVGSGRLQIALKRELSRGRLVPVPAAAAAPHIDAAKVTSASLRALPSYKGYAKIRKERVFEANGSVINPLTTAHTLDECMEPELTEIEQRTNLDVDQDASEVESAGHSSMDNIPKVPDSTHPSESMELLNCDAYKKSRALNGLGQDVSASCAGVEMRGASCLPTPSPSPVEMKTFETGTLGMESSVERVRLDPVEWTILDVFNYFKKAGFEDQAAAFQEQEIDGKSLLLMKRSDVLTGLSIKLGPALKIYEFHVKTLQMSHLKGSSPEC
ncbi:sterile alpha motif domain-containing protein 13 [Amblyraja radiata]|uniref:sterile alpha motif domain-containing protein 13 n=1 Tax=Amblyraja radiata TaxID=386614 RepID=UPI001401E620|nr:sterile alpha motif domain-containing protein 13 [Amblyraja radiata]XP_032884969.1 sterile alpha motif domain-containing protein 13 [Amblyraja radiata]